MNILQKIKQDQLEARKQRDLIRAQLLTTLYSEAAKIGKDAGNRESTDAEVIAVVQKFIKTNNEFQNLQIAVAADQQQVLKIEAEILSSYLPTQLSSEEVLSIIEQHFSEGKQDIGSLMRVFKDNYAGRYDAAVVSKLVKQKIVG